MLAWQPLQPLFEQEQRLAGLTVSKPDAGRLDRLLAPRLTRMSIDVRAYAERCSSDPLERLSLLDFAPRMESRWFADRRQFTDFEQRLLPMIAARQRHTARPRIRIWCAASGTGQEAYAVALCLARALPARERWDAAVLATEVSLGDLAAGQIGLYGDTSGLDTSEQKALFIQNRKSPRLWSVRPELRRLVQFSWLNAHAEWPFTGPFDAIFCADLLGRLESIARRRIIDRFAEALTPSGTLYTNPGAGASDLSERLPRSRGPSIHQLRARARSTAKGPR